MVKYINYFVVATVISIIFINCNNSNSSLGMVKTKKQKGFQKLIKWKNNVLKYSNEKSQDILL